MFVVHQFLYGFASVSVRVVGIRPLLDLTFGPSLSTMTSMDVLVLFDVEHICFVKVILNKMARHGARVIPIVCVCVELCFCYARESRFI